MAAAHAHIYFTHTSITFAQFLTMEGLLDGGLKFRPMTLPDRWIEHGNYSEQLAAAGLTAGHIAGTALSILGRKQEASKYVLRTLR